MMVFNCWTRGARSLLALAAAAALLGGEARASNSIGVASVVKNNVTGVISSSAVRLSPGASVVRDETVKTAQESSAKIVFTDSTNLAIGPGSAVRLTHFVSAGPSSYGQASIDVAKGVFRFTTGSSDKRAYQVNTGAATIGVRGTVFEGSTANRKTRIHVIEGVVIVHTRHGRVCEIAAGESRVITEDDCLPVVGFDPSFQFFSGPCSSAPELCERQEFAQVAQPRFVQPLDQAGFFGGEAATYALPAAGVAGAVAGGVAAGVSNSSSQAASPPVSPSLPASP